LKILELTAKYVETCMREDHKVLIRVFRKETDLQSAAI